MGITSNMKIYIVMIGRKMMNLMEVDDGTIKITCPCYALNRVVVVKLTRAQAEEIFCRDRTNRRMVRDILPDTPPQVQEIFISGTTPAEWDINVLGRKAQSKEAYSKLGYYFSED